MYSNRKSGDAFKPFCQEFVVPEKITFYGYKDQACKRGTFMVEVHKQGVEYHISEPELHNQNPVENSIR